MNLTPSLIWLSLMVAFLIIEAAAPGLVSIWMAFGALVAVIPALLGAPVWLQIAVFLAVSLASLLLTRPLCKKYLAQKKLATNADAVIGKECIVTERIDNVAGTGAVKTDGKVWTARSFDDAVTIEADTRVTAVEIKGVKLIVEPRRQQ